MTTTEADQREIESLAIQTYRLSKVERAAVRLGMDAAAIGHFAPENEIEEFYRLHRGV